MIFTASDIDAMLDPFAVQVIANKGTNNEFRFRGILDKPSQDYTVGDEGFATIQNDTTLTIQSSTATQLQVGTKIFVNYKNYRAAEFMEDESIDGYTKVVLKKI